MKKILPICIMLTTPVFAAGLIEHPIGNRPVNNIASSVFNSLAFHADTPMDQCLKNKIEKDYKNHPNWQEFEYKIRLQIVRDCSSELVEQGLITYAEYEEIASYYWRYKKMDESGIIGPRNAGIGEIGKTVIKFVGVKIAGKALDHMIDKAVEKGKTKYEAHQKIVEAQNKEDAARAARDLRPENGGGCNRGDGDSDRSRRTGNNSGSTDGNTGGSVGGGGGGRWYITA